MSDASGVSATVSKRQLRGAETRERVLASASRLFATQGFDATSVEAIAAAAGITVPGMYKHFAAKHDLLLAVARRSTRTSAARRALAIGPDLASGLADLFGEYLADGEVERRRLSIELSRAAFQNPELRSGVAIYNSRLRERLAATILDRGGAVDGAEAALLAHLMLVLLMGAIHLDTLDADRIGDPSFTRFVADRLRTVFADQGSSAPQGDARDILMSAVAVELDEPEPDDGRRARAVRTQRRILAAAHDLFALHGYDGTTLEMIAGRADVTVPGLYRHVESKEELLVTVARRAFGRYRLANPLDGRGGVVVYLVELLAAFTRSTDEVNRRLAIELDFGAWRSPALADALREFHLGVRRNVATSLALADGVPPNADHEMRALLFLMLFMGVAHLDTVDPSLVGDASWVDLLRRRVPQLVG